jgi:hypothetical protein
LIRYHPGGWGRAWESIIFLQKYAAIPACIARYISEIGAHRSYLSIPIREDALREVLRQAHAGWELIRKLTSEAKLIAVEYKGQLFYLRKLS